MFEFDCNICGARNHHPSAELPRESSTCKQCGSSVRYRSIIHLLTKELFGRSMGLQELPVLKQVKGLGMTDWWGYDGALADRFSYTNSFFDREPRFDITAPDPRQTSQYDFLISTEVFEHVNPPVELAFENAVRVLKPNGFLILTVPFQAGEGDTVEHFPELNDYRIVELGEEFILVNRRKDGSIETSRDLRFHGGPGNTLELRLFTEADLIRKLTAAGFREAVVLKDNCQQFGVQWHEPWSRPIIARKEPFSFSGQLVWELAQALASQQETLEELRNPAKAMPAPLLSESLGTLDALRQHKQLVLRYDHLAQQFSTLRQQVAMASRSRWLALGRMLKVGPRFDES